MIYRIRINLNSQVEKSEDHVTLTCCCPSMSKIMNLHDLTIFGRSRLVKAFSGAIWNKEQLVALYTFLELVHLFWILLGAYRDVPAMIPEVRIVLMRQETQQGWRCGQARRIWIFNEFLMHNISSSTWSSPGFLKSANRPTHNEWHEGMCQSRSIQHIPRKDCVKKGPT